MVNYPEPDFRMKKEGDNTFIFDNIRKLWLLLTEEEWVRQNFIQYMTLVLKYPVAYIAVEKELILNEMKKRFDILVYNKEFQPWMLVECKARQVPLNEKVLQQVLRYNITIPVNYMIITNGSTTAGWKKEATDLQLLHQMPQFNV
jgi:hypothetical protein